MPNLTSIQGEISKHAKKGENFLNLVKDTCKHGQTATTSSKVQLAAYLMVRLWTVPPNTRNKREHPLSQPLGTEVVANTIWERGEVHRYERKTTKLVSFSDDMIDL